MNGKYTYFEIETGYYSWDAVGKTVTISREKVISPESFIVEEQGLSQIIYGQLLTKSEYRASLQTMLNQSKERMGEAEWNTFLAEQGFSSDSEYIDSVLERASPLPKQSIMLLARITGYYSLTRFCP